MSQSSTIDSPQAARAGQGDEARWWWGHLAIIKTTGEQTNGGLTVVDMTAGPERRAPLHVHHREDETFVILEGSLTLQIGDREIEARPGDVVVGPRDVPHSYVAGPQGARMLFLLAPAGLEDLIREQSIAATSRTLPPEGTSPPDLEKAREIAQKYGCELLV